MSTTRAKRAADLASVWRRHERAPVAADAIYAALRESILTRVLSAGERLSELQLAALFNRSRTPVREALLRLESEHLAERAARQGLVVAAVNREAILEIYAVREVIDGLAARLAAQTCSASDLGHLTWLNDRLRGAARQHNYRLMVDLNLEFHESLARAGRNGLLQQLMRQIHDWVRRFSDTTFSYRGRAAEALDEHDALIAAIGRHDGETAERIAREHMARATQIRIAMLQQARGHWVTL